VVGLDESAQKKGLSKTGRSRRLEMAGLADDEAWHDEPGQLVAYAFLDTTVDVRDDGRQKHPSMSLVLTTFPAASTTVSPRFVGPFLRGRPPVAAASPFAAHV
jgi:hypothetical protein